MLSLNFKKILLKNNNTKFRGSDVTCELMESNYSLTEPTVTKNFFKYLFASVDSHVGGQLVLLSELATALGALKKRSQSNFEQK